jgi:hypothetical protein
MTEEGVQELQEFRSCRSSGVAECVATNLACYHKRSWRHASTTLRLHDYSVVLRLAGLEKDEFGSVMLSFGVLAPLWQEASEITSPAKRTRPAHLNRLRIRDDSRTNSRCKSTKNKVREIR